jgi:putative membrane-bound dehydrogenase-like protein
MTSTLFRIARLGCLGALMMTATSAAADGPAGGPLPPAEELAKLKLADPALAIELVAAEPDVISPVAIAWDEDGRLFAVEMTDYPTAAEGGRIRLLVDADGDGRHERSTIFAEGLPFPTSVLPWRGGVLVTAAPNLWFFKDEDGDGRADEKRVLLTGFGEGNTQLRVNGLTWGRDNWISIANGRSGGDVRRPEDPAEKAVSLRRSDARFNPETGEIEAVAGLSQFGLPRDDRGDRFPSWNTIPWKHVVIEEQTLSRNPYLAESSSVASVFAPNDEMRIFPISPAQARFNRESVSTFNASCGPTIYRGDALGGPYLGNAFVCESLTNLVHRRILEPVGPTYQARRAEEGCEFLASTDPCFRPVNLATGPDGALYVVDFYREMVEHPQFVAEEMRKSVDFRRWADRGRIWRIKPKEGDKAATPPRLGKASTADLVAALGNPNAWWRDTAQRLLVERKPADAAPALAEALKGSEEPLARLHALWTLDGLKALDQQQIVGALKDADARVREAAARLAGGLPALAPDIAALADDADARVRFQAAIALGNLAEPAAVAALARIAARDCEDEWARLAVLSGLGETAAPFLRTLLDANPGWLAKPTAAQGRLLEQTAAILGVRHREEELKGLLGRIEPGAAGEGDRGRLALLAGLVDGLARTGADPKQLLASPPPGWQAEIARVNALLDRSAAEANGPEGTAAGRLQVLQVLARCRPEGAAKLVPAFLEPGQPDAVRGAAARALGEIGSPELATEILGRWAELTTATRREVLGAVLNTAALVPIALDAIEAGTIGAAELDAAGRDSLKRVADPEVRRRAEAFLASTAPPDRGEVLRTYQAALEMPGDPARGADLFAKNCQTCHQFRGKGAVVGPDLSGIPGRPASALLVDILDPNQQVSPDFVTFVAVTKRGQVFTGLLAAETATSIKLRLAGGAEETILRSEIEELRSSGRSLMTEGLEQTLGPQGVADILSFFNNPR